MIVKKAEVEGDFGEVDRFELEIENEQGQNTGFSIGNLGECPEDANLGRDLSFVFGIERMLRMAYEAGKKGENFEVLETETIE